MSLIYRSQKQANKKYKESPFDCSQSGCSYNKWKLQSRKFSQEWISYVPCNAHTELLHWSWFNIVLVQQDYGVHSASSNGTGSVVEPPPAQWGFLNLHQQIHLCTWEAVCRAFNLRTGIRILQRPPLQTLSLPWTDWPTYTPPCSPSYATQCCKPRSHFFRITMVFLPALLTPLQCFCDG